MGLNEGGQFNEVDDKSYLAGTVTLSTSQTELKVGASRLDGRQNLLVFNKSSVVIYIGPTGVTSSNGIPIAPNQMFSYPFGQNIAVYGIVAAGSQSIIVHEIG